MSKMNKIRWTEEGKYSLSNFIEAVSYIVENMDKADSTSLKLMDINESGAMEDPSWFNVTGSIAPCGNKVRLEFEVLNSVNLTQLALNDPGRTPLMMAKSSLILNFFQESLWLFARIFSKVQDDEPSQLHVMTEKGDG